MRLYSICHCYSKAGASLIAQLVKNLPAMQETPVWFLGREDRLEKGQATHSQYSWAALVAQLVKIHLQCGRPGLDHWVGKILLPTPGFWPGEFHGLYSLWGHKKLDTTERCSLHFIAKQLVQFHWGTYMAYFPLWKWSEWMFCLELKSSFQLFRKLGQHSLPTNVFSLMLFLPVLSFSLMLMILICVVVIVLGAKAEMNLRVLPSE